MTPAEKVENLAAQVRAVARGATDTITCPFCGLVSTPVQTILCCNAAADVVIATLNHVVFKKQVETVERIMDRLQTTQRNR